MQISEWIGLAILLAIPYLVIGTVWAFTHSGPFLGSVLAWPCSSCTACLRLMTGLLSRPVKVEAMIET